MLLARVCVAYLLTRCCIIVSVSLRVGFLIKIYTSTFFRGRFDLWPRCEILEQRDDCAFSHFKIDFFFFTPTFFDRPCDGLTPISQVISRFRFSNFVQPRIGTSAFTVYVRQELTFFLLLFYWPFCNAMSTLPMCSAHIAYILQFDPASGVQFAIVRFRYVRSPSCNLSRFNLFSQLRHLDRIRSFALYHTRCELRAPRLHTILANF